MALLWYLYRGICDLQQMPLEDSMRLEKGKVSLGWESEGLFNVEVDRNYGWWGGGEEWRRGLARQEEKEEDGDIYIAEYCVGLPTIQSFWEEEDLVSWIYDAVVPSDIVMGIRIKLRYDAILSLSLTLPTILHIKILLLSGHPLEVRKTTIQLPAWFIRHWYFQLWSFIPWVAEGPIIWPYYTPHSKYNNWTGANFIENLTRLALSLAQRPYHSEEAK